MDVVLVAALLVPPVSAALVALLASRRPAAAAWYSAVAMPVSAAAAVAIAIRLAFGGAPVVVGQAWRLDALSALLALLIGLVTTLATWLGPGLNRQSVPSSETRPFRVYAGLFAFTMLVAVSTSNLGVMWVSIEATTVTSALLIPLRRTQAAIEASWKYLLIGSVGIALAFTGTVLAFVDYASTGRDPAVALQWMALVAAAPSLHPEVAQLAFVFLLVGFGTKAGLAPMHTWLPDAHSEAPAPLSAMMSGVLLAVALYAIARWKAVVDLAIGSAFTDTMLLVVGTVTVFVGSASLLSQTQYKRLLAFSSIEHMGLACFALALGPLGVFAALLHVTGHALAKSVAFLLSGRIYDRYRSADIDHVPGLLGTSPPTGILFLAAVLALAGLPPFSLFLSEILIVQAAWSAGHPLLTALVLLLILLAFASLLTHVQHMLFGEAPADVARDEGGRLRLAVLAVPLAMLVWIGVALPEPLRMLLSRAAEVVGR
ncbi:MAG TPA: proton-conducting transporter membrane subunit [Vicinamibacterales bacterium]